MIEYTYDMAGIRDSKTVDGVEYNYLTLDGKVVRQTWGSNVLDIIYNNSGLPYALKYNGGYYIYVLNQQGDVIRIVNSTGATVAEYRYDVWGNVTYSNGSVAAINPIRYRGYYYDTETGFYYLQSRYYDPGTGRFINADSFTSTGQGFLGSNMFAYCLNNPVVFVDTHGSDACVVIDDNQAWGFGHIGFFAQDDEGTWWHFYWGPEHAYLPIIGINVEPVTWVKEYKGDISLEAINASGQYSRAYHRMIYLSGDFSDCIEQATNLDAQYNLYFENCSQVSLSILASANTPHKNYLESAAKKTIPKRAFKYVEESCVSPAYNGSTGGSGRNLFYTKY